MSDYHPDEAHIVTGSMLAIVFAAWIDAYAEDREPPEVQEVLAEKPRSIEPLDLCRALLGVPDAFPSKVRLMRFLAALSDVIARDGAELQCLMHAHLKPEEEERVVVVIPASELEKLRALDEVMFDEVKR